MDPRLSRAHLTALVVAHYGIGGLIAVVLWSELGRLSASRSMQVVRLTASMLPSTPPTAGGPTGISPDGGSREDVPIVVEDR